MPRPEIPHRHSELQLTAGLRGPGSRCSLPAAGRGHYPYGAVSTTDCRPLEENITCRIMGSRPACLPSVHVSSPTRGPIRLRQNCQAPIDAQQNPSGRRPDRLPDLPVHAATEHLGHPRKVAFKRSGRQPENCWLLSAVQLGHIGLSERRPQQREVFSCNIPRVVGDLLVHLGEHVQFGVHSGSGRSRPNPLNGSPVPTRAMCATWKVRTTSSQFGISVEGKPCLDLGALSSRRGGSPRRCCRPKVCRGPWGWTTRLGKQRRVWTWRDRH